MAEWQSVPLADALDFQEGPGILAKDFRNAGVPLIRLAGVKQGASILDGCNFLDADMVERKWRHFRLREGDVLLSTSASLGEVAIVDRSGVDAIPYTGLIRFRPASEDVSASYISIALTSATFKQQIEAMGVGSVMRHFGPMHLRQMTIELPPLAAQRAIAEVLGALDDKIAANTSFSASTEAAAFALVEGAHELVPLGHLVTHAKVQVDPAVLTAAKVAHFSLPAFDAGRMAEIVPPLEIKSSKFAVERPSVLISKLNPRFPRVWDVAAVPAIPALASTEFLVLEPRFSSTTFLWALLLQPSFGSSLESKVSGTSGSHQRVRPDDLLATPIADPRAFGDDVKALVTSLGLRAAQARDESVALAATRDALLPALMSGRLRVRDAERIVSTSV